MNKILQNLSEVAIRAVKDSLTPTNLIYLLLGQMVLPVPLSYVLYLLSLDQLSVLGLLTPVITSSVYISTAWTYAESAKSLLDIAQSWRSCYEGSIEECGFKALAELFGQEKAVFLSDLIDYDEKTIASDAFSKVSGRVRQEAVKNAKNMASLVGQQAIKDSEIVVFAEKHGFKASTFLQKAWRSLWK